MPWVKYPRVDLLFDIHSQECWDGNAMPAAEQKQWEREANDLGVMILCRPCRLHLFENADLFPFDEVHALDDKTFLENSIAYQLAYALWTHRRDPIERVDLYGVNMMGKREYLWERASVVYWAGVLRGNGIEIQTPPGSALFMSYWTSGRYGETAEKRFSL
jgi:hypothetical protein